MMLDRPTILTLFAETAKVFGFNLDFVPEDKFDWQPAPGAKSALALGLLVTGGVVLARSLF